MRSRLLPTFSLAAALIGASAYAQTLNSTYAPGPDLKSSIASVEDFQKQLSLHSSAVAPNSAPEIQPILTSPQGKVIIVSSHVSALGEPQVLISLIDEHTGKPLEIRPSSINGEDSSGRKLELTIEPIDKMRIPSTVVLTIDASGSMDGNMPEVISSANHLYNALPDHFTCLAVVFSDASQVFGAPTLPCTSRSVGLPQLSAGGNTNIFTAISRSLDAVNAQNDSAQRAVLVITDGEPSDCSDRILKEILAKKGDTQLIFFWLGASDPGAAEDKFRPIADHFVKDRQGARKYLDDYFRIYADKINKQSVVTIK